MNHIYLPDDRREQIRSLFPEFSDKQFLCMFYYSLGFSSKKIGNLIGCSAKTVRNRLQELKEKLLLDSSSDLRVVFLVRLLAPGNYHTCC